MYEDLFSDDDILASIYGEDYLEEERKREEEEAKYSDEERGFLGDVGIALGRGATRTVELGGEALERIGVSNPIDDFAEYIRDEYLKPDKGEDDGYWYRGAMSALESAPTTLAVIGGTILTGGAGGALALGVIGAGTDQLAQEDYLKVHPGDIEGAKIHGLKTGLSEAGTELLSDIIPFAGKAFKFGGKAGITSLKKMVGSMSAKEIGTRVAASYAAEGSTELANAAYQAQLNNEAGISTVTPGEAMVETIAPVLFMGAGLSAATVGMTAMERAKVRDALGSGAPAEVRTAVANNIAKSLESKTDKETADKWLETANYNINEGLDIPISATFDETYESMEARKEEVKDIDPLTQDTDELDKSVDAKLKDDAPIIVNEAAVFDNMSGRLDEATDEEILKLGNNSFNRYIKSGLLTKDEAKVLDGKLGTKFAEADKKDKAAKKVEADKVTADKKLSKQKVDDKKAFDARVKEIVAEGEKKTKAETKVPKKVEVAATAVEKAKEARNKYMEEQGFFKKEEGGIDATPKKRDPKVIAKAAELNKAVKAAVLAEKGEELSAETNLAKKAKIAKEIRKTVEESTDDVALEEIKKVIKESPVAKDATEKEITKLAELKLEKDKESLKAEESLGESKLETGQEGFKVAKISDKTEDSTISANLVEWEGSLKTDKFIMGRGVDKVNYAISEKEDGSLSIKSDESDKILTVPKSKGMYTKAKQMVNTAIAQSKEGKAEVAKVKAEKVERTEEVKGKAKGKGITGFTKRATESNVYEGTIDDKVYSLDNVIKGEGKGWYEADKVGQEGAKLGDTKVLAIVALKEGKVLKKTAEQKRVAEGTGKVKSVEVTPEMRAKLEGKTEAQAIKDSLKAKKEKWAKGDEVAEEAPGDKILGTASDLSNPRKWVEGLRDRQSNRATAWFLDYALTKLDPAIIDNLKLEIDDTIDAKGLYFSQSHRIKLRSTSSDTTALHELVHALTSRALYTDKVFAKKVSKIYEDFLDSPQGQTWDYGIKNEHEFLAEAVSSVSFRYKLSQISGNRKGSTLFTDLKDAIFKLLSKAMGTKKLAERSMLHDVIDTILLDNSGFKELSKGQKEGIGTQYRKRADLSEEGLARRSEEVAQRREDEVAEAAEGPKDAAEKSKEITAQQEDRLIKEAAKQETITSKLKSVWAQSKKTTAKYLKTVSSALREIDPILATKVTEFERQYNKRVRDRLKNSNQFVKEMKKLKKEDFDSYVLLDFAMKNGNTKEVDRILSHKPELRKEVNEAIKINGDIRKEAIQYGMEGKGVTGFYMHRQVKDLKGLTDHLEKISEAKMKRKAEKEGKPYKPSTEYSLIKEQLIASGMEKPTQRDIAEVFGKMMETGQWPAYLKKPGSAKLRKIKELTIGMNKFYEGSEDAFVTNVIQMTEAVEARKMMGVKSKRATWMAELDELAEGNNERTRDRREQLSNLIKNTEDELDTSIGMFLSLVSETKVLTRDQIKEAATLIKARLQQNHMSKGMGYLRDLSLISALGSPYSTITQLGDLPHIVYHRGFKATLPALLGKKLYNQKDFDFSGYVRETQSATGFSHILDKVLKLTQFQRVDQFFKSTAMQASLNQAKSMSFEQFEAKYGTEYLNTKEVYDDIQTGEKSENVASFVWKELSKRQPISPSEMPLGYLQGKNTRIMYALKSYNIKAMNSIRDDFMAKKETFGATKASMASMYYITLLTMSGVGADELKDLLGGKDHEELSDSVLDNLGKIFFFGRYSQINFGKSGPSDYIADLLMPAFGLADNPVKDLYALATGEDLGYKSVKEIPVIGKLAWDRSDTGRSSEMKMRRRNILEVFEKAVNAKGSLKEVRKRINKFNKDARKYEDVRSINFISSRKYYIKKRREEAKN